MRAREFITERRLVDVDAMQAEDFRQHLLENPRPYENLQEYRDMHEFLDIHATPQPQVPGYYVYAMVAITPVMKYINIACQSQVHELTHVHDGYAYFDIQGHSHPVPMTDKSTGDAVCQAYFFPDVSALHNFLTLVRLKFADYNIKITQADQKLTEIEAYRHGFSGSLGMNTLRTTWGLRTDQQVQDQLKHIRRRARALPGSQYQYAVLDGDRHLEKFVYILDADQQILGSLDIMDYGPVAEVSRIELLPEHRGHGLGLALYGIVLSVLNKPLIAGESQSPDARKAWLRISKIPGVTMQGVVKVPLGQEPLYQEQLDYIQARPWRKLGGFMIYVFPVKAGKNQLNTAAPGSNIRIYHAYRQNPLETSLMATFQAGQVNTRS